jgi:hypothetical protein
MAQAALILSLAGAAGSALSQSSQASRQAEQEELAARQQEVQVKQREADRKDRLASALATQNVMAGAKNIAAFEGSPLTILQDSIERERVGTERDRFSTELSTLALRSTSRSRKRMANINAALGLTQTVGQLGMVGTGAPS